MILFLTVYFVSLCFMICFWIHFIKRQNFVTILDLLFMIFLAIAPWFNTVATLILTFAYLSTLKITDIGIIKKIGKFLNKKIFEKK